MVVTEFFNLFVLVGKSLWKLTAEDPHAGGLEFTNSSIKTPYKLKKTACESKRNFSSALILQSPCNCDSEGGKMLRIPKSRSL